MSDVIVRLEATELTSESPLCRALLALNATHEVELSPLNLDGLRHLVFSAVLACGIGEADALLLAVDQDAAYESPNFLWFRDRYERFVYVDHIVVAPAARGRGLARRLYERLFEVSRSAGHVLIVCEVNSTPPNLASEALHRSLKFQEVGEGRLATSGKTVRYLARRIAPVRPPRA